MNRTRQTMLCISALALVSCASPPAAEDFRIDPPLPYRIYVYVDDEPSVLPEATGEEEEPESSTKLRVEPRNIERELRSAGQELCTEIVVLEESERSRDKALADARRQGVDLFLEVGASDPPGFTSNRNAWFLPNTLLWFLLGFPSFWVKDREFEVRWPVELNVRSVGGDASTPGAEAERLRLADPVALNVSERGFSAEALYTPPGFYDGPQLGERLARHAERLVVAEVKRVLRDHRVDLSGGDGGIDIVSPVNHSTVSAEGAAITVKIGGESPEVLRIELDGRVLLERGAISRLLDPRTTYTWSIADVLNGLDGLDLAADADRGSIEWSATRTISFSTDRDDEPHRLRVFVRAGALARQVRDTAGINIGQ